KKLSKTLGATDVRKLYFGIEEPENGIDWADLVPVEVAEVMKEFRQTPDFEDIKDEYQYTEDYKKRTRFVGFDYDPTFVTTDAVVVARGHVLIVRRGHQPGKGQLALPGGFLTKGSRLRENCVKELKEETRINVDANLLRRAIKDHEVFDDPDRS